MSKKVTTQDFISRAREVHGDRYDYSKSVYVSATTPMTIICPEHGEFQQRPVNHTMGRGCRDCAGNKPLTIAKFIERANAKHHNRYDYSQVAFEGVENKVTIICSEHGPFEQRVMVHLKGFNCPKCGREQVADKLSHSLERFISDAIAAHSDKYDYTEVEYVNALSNVKIVCPVHGPFFQKPANHVRGVGCSKCSDIVAADKRRLSTEEFIERAREIHGGKYDYSKAVYITGHDKVEIICPEHGVFWQSAVNHTKGNKAGCPGCAVSGFDQTKPALLYYLAVMTDNSETLYKIGITNLNVQKRFPNVDLARIRVIKTWSYESGAEAAKRELSVLQEFSDDLYTGVDVLIGAGNTELFVRDVLGLDPDKEVQEFKQWKQNKLI
jgi:predicted RNA-binding Zn-ribbon protein involved in translation (DUF1610 family)